MRLLVVTALLAFPLACADGPAPSRGTDQTQVRPDPPVPPPLLHAPPEPLSVEAYGPAVDAPPDAIDISIDAGGGVWVTSSKGLFLRPAGSPFFLRFDNGAAPRAVGGLGPNLAAASWETGSATLIRLATQQGLRAQKLDTIDAASTRIRSFDAQSGALTLVASGAQIVRLAPDGRVQATRALPAPVEASDLALSSRGDVWIGSRVGIFRLRLSPLGELGTDFLPTLDLVPGLDDDIVALDGCADGTIWASSLGHGVFHLRADGQVLAHLGKEDVLPQDHVLSIACDPDGSVWLGTSWGGLVRRMDDGSYRYHTQNAGLLGDSIRRLVIEVDGDGQRTLWIATEGGLASYIGQ